MGDNDIAWLLQIAEKHVKRFSRLVDAALQGQPGIRLSECENYLSLWQSISEKLKSTDVIPFTREEIAELKDAIEDARTEI